MRKMIVSKECDEIYETVNRWADFFFFALSLYILIKSLFNNKKE